MDEKQYVDRWRKAAKRSLVLRTNSRQGICETLRLIYDDVYEMPEGEIKERMTELLIDATLMAKKMQTRLVYYKEKYHDDTGNNGENLKRIWKSAERYKKRKARMI